MRFGQIDHVCGMPLSCWRSTSGFEVDFIIGDHTAVEVKAKENVAPQDLKPLLALAEEKKLKRYLLISLEPRPRKVESVTILPYDQFLEALWSGANG
jgi:predicted AAA+ superfamily ATPase